MDMKRKILLIVTGFYISLNLIIVAVGLNIQQEQEPLIPGTEAAPGRTDGQPDNLGTSSPTAIVDVETQVWTETPDAAVEVTISPSPQPTMTQTPTAAAEETIQPSWTFTPSAPTSTSPAYPVSGEGTITATITPGSYPVNESNTATVTPSLTVTPTTASTTQTGWGGDWMVIWEQADGRIISGLMSVSVNGSGLTAALSVDEEQYDFEGILNESQVTVVGSWSGGSNSGNFYWRTLSSGQFVGNLDRQSGFCGSRLESDMPDPCLEAPDGK